MEKHSSIKPLCLKDFFNNIELSLKKGNIAWYDNLKISFH